MGNMHSVWKHLTSFGVECAVSAKPQEILKASKLILPGVGHFGQAMENLEQQGLVDVLNELVMHKKIPILGICLGMQLMADYSEEGNTDGLGWIFGKVRRLQVKDTLRFKVPHMGWNQIRKQKKSKLLEGISGTSEFYFLHSYHLMAEQNDVLSETSYSCEFTSAVERENIYGVQFHPEKSHSAGRILLNNFIKI